MRVQAALVGMAGLFLSVSASHAVAQSSAFKVPQHLPEGIWEFSGPSGGAVGLNLWSERSPDWEHDSVTTGVEAPQEKAEHVFGIGVYQRASAKLQCGDENFFDTKRQAGSESAARYEPGRLTLEFPASHGSVPAIDLDLEFHPAEDQWVGRFHRGAFDRQVVLRRDAGRLSRDGELCVITGPHDWPIKPLEKSAEH